jgi:hypothetical protein
MAYTITWKERGIVWEYSGTMTGEELLQSNLEIFGDARFDDLRYQIADMSAVEDTEISEIHVRKMAYLDSAAARSNPHICVAIVSSSEDAFRVGTAYIAHSKEKSPWKTRVFSTREEAEAWVKEMISSS